MVLFVSAPDGQAISAVRRITREGSVVILLTSIDIRLDVRSVVEMGSRHGDRLG
jgi:hypothetical protein